MSFWDQGGCSLVGPHFCSVVGSRLIFFDFLGPHSPLPTSAFPKKPHGMSFLAFAVNGLIMGVGRWRRDGQIFGGGGGGEGKRVVQGRRCVFRFWDCLRFPHQFLVWIVCACTVVVKKWGRFDVRFVFSAL